MVLPFGILCVAILVFRDAAILSTKLGYGRPAFFAAALADAFWAGVNGVDLLLGFLVSQIFLATIISFSF